MEEENISALLQKSQMFHDLTQEELERLEEITISRYISKRSMIFTEDDKEAVYFIQDGLVKTYKTDENGHEQIVSFLKTGDMFPHTGFFNQNPYPATAEALIDTKLLAIPVKLFEQVMLHTPSIAVKLMRVMGDKIQELQDKLQVLSGQDVRHRVLSFLELLAEQHGDQDGDKIIINLPMTNQEFANFVGTSRETINRLLNQLSKENFIAVDRSRIIINNLQGLMELRESK